MPETFYTRAINRAFEWGSHALAHAHDHAQLRLAQVDHHAAAVSSYWQQRQPWLANVSLQRRSALRFRVHWRVEQNQDMLSQSSS